MLCPLCHAHPGRARICARPPAATRATDSSPRKCLFLAAHATRAAELARGRAWHKWHVNRNETHSSALDVVGVAGSARRAQAGEALSKQAARIKMPSKSRQQPAPEDGIHRTPGHEVVAPRPTTSRAATSTPAISAHMLRCPTGGVSHGATRDLQNPSQME